MGHGRALHRPENFGDGDNDAYGEWDRKQEMQRSERKDCEHDVQYEGEAAAFAQLNLQGADQQGNGCGKKQYE